MTKAHENIGWENKPSDKSPINKRNLNKMDYSIDVIDDRVIVLDSTKATKVEVSPLIKEVAYDEKTGIITFTRKNGAVFTIDTPMEKIALNIYYDPVTEMLTLPLVDGTYMEVDLSRLITEFEFLDSETIAFSVSADGKVTAIVKEGSIGEQHLRPNYLADIKVEAGKAQASAAAAAASEAAAAESEQNAADSAAAAAESQRAAAGSASAAAASEAAATQKAAAAQASAEAAAASQEAAAESAAAAGASATAAAGSATAADTSQKAAAASVATASQKADDAADSAAEAESYAHGGTGTRPGEDEDNAKKYYEGAKEIFQDLEGAGAVFGVKGSEEEEYRSGFVNLSPEDIGALPVLTSSPSYNTFEDFWSDANKHGIKTSSHMCAMRFKDTGGWTPSLGWWCAIVGFQNGIGSQWSVTGRILLMSTGLAQGGQHVYYGLVDGGSTTTPEVSVTWYKVYSEIDKPSPDDIGALNYYSREELGIERSYIEDIIAALPNNSLYQGYAKKEDPVVAAAGITDNYSDLRIFKRSAWLIAVTVTTFGNRTYHWAGNSENPVKLVGTLPLTGGELTGTLVPSGGIDHVGRDRYISYPEDGYFEKQHTVTGGLIIVLPISWISTMVKFTVSIFNYCTNESTEYLISGHTWDNLWYNCTAVCVGNAAGTLSNLPVRFIIKEEKPVVVIGESTTSWDYPIVKICNILVGFGNVEYSHWRKGWNISIGDISSYTARVTIANTHVGYGSIASSCTGNAATADNAAKVGNMPVSHLQGGNTIVTRDSNGYTYLNYINCNTGDNENNYVSQVITTNGSDNFYRKVSLHHLKTSMALNNVDNTADTNKNVATAREVTGMYTGNGGAQPPSYVTSGRVRFNMMDRFPGFSANGYMDTILMDTYGGGDVPWVTGIGVTKAAGNPRMFIAAGSKGNSAGWSYMVEAITSGNIGSQSVNYAASAIMAGVVVKYDDNNNYQKTILDHDNYATNIYNRSNSEYLKFGRISSTNNITLCPSFSSTIDLGTGAGNFKWNVIYAKSGTIQTSDRNKKEDIHPLSDKYLDFFMQLNPVSYKMIDGNSGRTHVGYVSQEVEEALQKVGLTALDFAGFCKDVNVKISADENGEMVSECVYDEDGNLEYNYSLRYTEFIALNTAVIQRQQRQIDKQEKIIQDQETRIRELENKMDILLSKLA